MRQVSGTSAHAVADQPAVRRRPAWLLSPYALPLHALRIAGACALPLIIWFSLGRVIRWGLLLLAATISHGEWYQARLVVVMFLFTLVVMASLVTTIGMLYILRGALMETQARRAAGEAHESLLNALNRTALVFCGIYLTWGFLAEDARDFMNIDLLRQPDRIFIDAFAGEESTVMRGLIGLDLIVSAVTMAVAWVVKTLFARRHEAGRGRFSGVIATCGELAFVLYGLNAVTTVLGARSDWVGSRVVVVAWQEWMEKARESIPGWKSVTDFIGEVWPYVVDALVLPLTWLTVGILVYGAYAEDTRTTIRGTPLERAAAPLERRTHALTRRALDRLTEGWTSRWIPLLHSLRLTMRGGAPLFGMFALCYVGLHIGGIYLERAGRYLLDTGEPYFWIFTSVPIEFVSELIVTTLSMCLIAATFDLAATRDRLARAQVSAGSAARDRSSPETSPLPS
jgi:hypothetical protein|nr:hypothetical protein [Actinomycetales bacterium]